jgi:SnoaL-like domain
MDLDTVLARAEITDLLGKYCRGVDRVDEATLRSIYHDDAVEDRGEDLFIGPAQEWVGWTLGLLPAFAATHHAIQNILIDVDGDVAHGETYFTAYHRFGGAAESEGEVTTDDVAWPEGGTELLLAGRYLDRFERRDGVWKIAYRKMVCDWCRTQEAADEWFSENPTVYRGIRKVSDSRLETPARG